MSRGIYKPEITLADNKIWRHVPNVILTLAAWMALWRKRPGQAKQTRLRWGWALPVMLTGLLILVDGKPIQELKISNDIGFIASECNWSQLTIS